MPDVRPLRRWRFIFRNLTDGRQQEIAVTGHSPCNAKDNAFQALSRHLREHPEEGTPDDYSLFDRYPEDMAALRQAVKK